ncbi:MAG: hypothetical protein JJU06_11580 [Ectothiorhodospiraceae bacterium]|nr:hypothetical protein [Ectothiorhodospiraceae bacterium]
MTRITCPRCRYTRKDVEDFPEWGCPSCGVAYEKVASPDALSAPEFLPDMMEIDTDLQARRQVMKRLIHSFFIAIGIFVAIGFLASGNIGRMGFGLWFMGLGAYFVYAARVMMRVEMFFGHPMQLRSKEESPIGFYIEWFATLAGGIALMLYGAGVAVGLC